MRTSRDHSNHSTIVKIGQNTEKSLGEEETCHHSNSSEKPLANAGEKNLKGVK